MRIRVLTMVVSGLALLGMGSNPRYLEELRIGGGYGDSADGGGDFDKSGNIATDGALDVGRDGVRRGVVSLWDGSGGNAPGVLRLGASDGSLRYVFVSNDGAGLRIHTALPTSDGDGAWPASGKFRGTGSTSDAVDLGTSEVSGTLPSGNVGSGLTDAQVNDNLTISGGVIDSTAVGTLVPSSGTFTSLRATGDLLVDGGDIGVTVDPDLLGLASGQLTIRGNAAVSGGQWHVGAEDATEGVVTLYGDDGSAGSVLSLQCSADNDGATNAWMLSAGLFGSLNLSGSGGSADLGLIWSVNPATGDVYYFHDCTIQGGDLALGQSNGVRGVLTACYGGGGVAPGCIKLESANGTASYFFVSNDGAGLRVHSALPTSDTAGSWPASGKFRGSGSTSDAVDLATSEVSGTLPASNVGAGLTDAQVDNSLTLSGGSIDNSPVGATTASSGRFTALTATGVLSSSTVTTFTANDTTPDVSGGNLFKIPASWTSGNNITAFDNGVAGQRIAVIGGDGDCVALDAGTLKLSGNWTGSTASTLELVYDGSNWFEISRSAN